MDRGKKERKERKWREKEGEEEEGGKMTVCCTRLERNKGLTVLHIIMNLLRVYGFSPSSIHHAFSFLEILSDV